MSQPIQCLIAMSTTLVLSGCAGAPAELTTAEALPGHTFAAVEGSLPADAGFLIQDASPRVGVAAAYSEAEFGADTWTVVAACSTATLLAESETIQIAVIPTSAVTAEVEGDIRDGKYRDAVTNCDEMN